MVLFLKKSPFVNIMKLIQYKKANNHTYCVKKLKLMQDLERTAVAAIRANDSFMNGAW